MKQSDQTKHREIYTQTSEHICKGRNPNPDTMNWAKEEDKDQHPGGTETPAPAKIDRQVQAAAILKGDQGRHGHK